MQVKISQAATMLSKFLEAKLVPMLVGSPGIGKSGIVHEIAKEYNLKVIDLRLSQCDPTDICGFPSIQGERASYLPMDTFPIEGDEVPEGYEGWLLFLDEFNSAAPAVQAASYKLVLDRMVGQHHLHKKVAIVAAGNLETDNAIVQPMSTALQSRMVHMELVVDSTDWCNWAMSNGIDHRITDYIKFKPSSLYTFKPDHTDKTYACPRTWEFTNRLMHLMDDREMILPLLSGTISEGVAREFIQYCKIYHKLPTLEQIMADPETVAVPDEPSTRFAVSGFLANHADKKNLNHLIKYIFRLPEEFQVVTLREVIRRKPEMAETPAIQTWIQSAVKFV